MARMGGGRGLRGSRSTEDEAEVVFRSEGLFQNKGRLLMFGCTDSFTSGLGHVANAHVSPFDAAFPGTLPVKMALHVPD